MLIAFAPYVRNDNAEALQIQESFQSSNDQKAFIRAARQFLEQQQEQQQQPGKAEGMSQNKKEEFKPREKEDGAPDFFSSTAQMSPMAVRPSPRPPTTMVAVAELEDKISGLTVKEDPVVPQTPPGTSMPAPSGLNSPISPPVGNWIPTLPGLAMTPAAMNTTPHPSKSTPVIPEAKVMMNSEVPETLEEVPETLAEAAKQKPVYQPKRLWTRIEQQPGRVLANNIPFGNTVNLRPRQELTAQWMLPVKYIRQHAEKFVSDESQVSLRMALEHLTVGLFRRGCTENTSSIISKEVVSKERQDYPFQLKGDVVVGSIPFFSPRTPGNVVLRLFWDNDSLYTLATGPTLAVQVTPADAEPTLRFILSNFKAKKGAATSLSSLHSFTTVLETFHVPSSSSRQQWDGAGRATWGCLCESRKGETMKKVSIVLFFACAHQSIQSL